jgi:malate dehydrogenase (oxaloacetate-decarboxylating)(NADP+)
VGVRHRRVRGEAYFDLLDEFLSAVRQRFGPSVLIDLEDMAHDTAAKIINAYRGAFPLYSDAHHGLPTLALAAVLGAQHATATPLAAHRFVLVGDSPALAAVAELLEEAVQRESRAGTVLEARRAIHLVDARGLVVRGRADAEELADHVLPYIQDAPECPDLVSTLRQVKPTVLIGLSDGAPPWAFTREVCEAMAESAARPVILPMSLHTPGGAPGGGEVGAEAAYAWTGGAALFADRHGGRGAVPLPGGGAAEPSTLDPVYVFPGVGLGTLMSRSTRLREEMFVEAAKALARLVSDEERAAGAVLPHISQARDIAAHVAAAVAGRAYNAGVATELPKPHDLLEHAYAWMYNPVYKRYR